MPVFLLNGRRNKVFPFDFSLFTSYMHTASNKTCPRCQQIFECRANDIANCQCSKVQLAPATREWLAKHYKDCLCANCLRAIQEEIVSNTHF
ncbi:MAG: cysteine-rich CWC family protein [Chitinophagaceae bacterium]